MKRTLILGCLAAPFLTLSFADEAKKDQPAAPVPPAESKPAAGDKKPEEKVDVTVTITGNDTMQYDKKAFTVTSGQKVKLVLKNVGKLPKAAMGHNVVILNKGVNKVAFAQSAMTAAPEYIPKASKDIFANTKLLGPGEEEAIVFTAPAAGNYDYLCTFPGHFALMSGVMTVK